MRRALAALAALAALVLCTAGSCDSEETKRAKACIAAGGSYDSGTWGHWTCKLPEHKP